MPHAGSPIKSAAESALRGVIDPTFGKSLGELEAVSDLRVEDTTVRFRLRIHSPSQEVRETLLSEIANAFAPLSLTPEVDWEISVPMRQTAGEDPLPEVRNIILVMSGKGGVGKSTVATNLVLALRRAGTRVGLLDADIYGPSIPTMLGIQGSPQSRDGKRILPLERFGIKLMSIGFLLEDAKQAVVWRGPMLHGALQQFLADVDWGPLDYLVLDLPPGTGDVALSIAQKCKLTGAVMVTTPQEVALTDVYKAVNMCTKLNIPLLGVVENMSYFVDSADVRHELFGAGGGQTIADFAKAPLLGQIPIETAVREWGDKGTPVVQAAPESKAAQTFTAIADRLATHIAREHFERAGGEKPPKAEAPKRLRILR